ncbi:hypothetical protein BHF71_07295 [Vulcanibacillus modesticaldus]|uniref:HD domain-containing protein n=1 Tax=Vulcanibacillus modesticaldus TaxID=337097 RepID=A0A1D2YW79_9BACI|nr:HD domain-containing protein [Vulcanibacillus modesticaldus]OEF99907.1 hypothetical protein BHF71_07295 [Vulcanibacillus modesticaldus]
MVSRLLLLRLFEAFSIQRWNDRIRPVELTEMDKQGLKAMLAYIFAKIEEEKGHKIDWNYIIYGSLFALMKNIALSDIKAPVLSKIKQDHPESYKELNKWVVNQYNPLIQDESLIERFDEFLNRDETVDNINLRILKAAHKYSTYREFEIIKMVNQPSKQLEKIEQDLVTEIKQYFDINGLKEMYMKKDLFEAINLIEQLRFQTRWSQTPRVPRTSVLGHSMLVASLMIFLSREVSACDKRLYNNFYAGLFHDLPEAVVRDIISPVKRATLDLPEIIKEIEEEVCKAELYPKLPKLIVEELYYLIGIGIKGGDEYSNRIKENGKARVLFENEKISEFNDDKYSPLDGKLIKLADEIAAFLEADQSIKHGIVSRHLHEGRERVRLKYIENSQINDVNVKEFFLSFD